MTLSPASRRRTAIAAAFALLAGLLSFGAPLSASADVVGDGPGTISGSVTLADGSPVSNRFVNVSKSFGEGTFWSFSTSTDANGYYEFTGLPADSISVQVFADGFQPPASQTVTLNETTPSATINFVLVPFEVGVGTISGVVTTDGTPASSIGVSVFNIGTWQYFNATTDENGYYEFSGLSNGNWQVNASVGPGYQYLQTVFVELSDAAPSATVDLAYISWPVGTAAISGTLTNAETGEPVANVNIQVNGSDVLHQSSVTTDETGSFTIDLLPEGSYWLSYSAFGYLAFTELVQAVSDETVTLSHALVPTNATVSGHVQTADGTPVEGLYVDAHNDSGNFGGANTDANGDYVITGLGAVEYTISFGGPGTPYDAQERDVLPVANGDVVANFTAVPRTTGYLSGWIVQPSGEAYLEPVCATLYGSKNKKPLAETVTLGDNFGDGTYSFDGLKPGKYTVEFRDCDDDPKTKFDKVFLGGVKNYKDATFVTINAGDDSYGNDIVWAPRS